MAKFEVTLNIGMNGEQKDVIEIDDEDLAGLTGEAREEFLHGEWKEWAGNYIDGEITEIKN